MRPRDVFDRSVCQQVGEIASPLDRREVFPQVLTAACVNGRPIRGLMGEVVGRAAEDSEELVVAMLVRTELRSPPEMPFADQGGVVAVLPDERATVGWLGGSPTWSGFVASVAPTARLPAVEGSVR